MADIDFADLLQTAKRAAAALRDAEVEFVLAGGIATWVRGGPPTEHDVDFAVRPADAERALEVLTEAGFEPERPPEEWLYKAHDGDVTVDVIFRPAGVDVDDGVFERSDELPVEAVTMAVMAAEDIIVSKLLALDDHHTDYESVLEITRALREQVDWSAVRARTQSSPYAAAFFTMAEGLGVIGGDDSAGVTPPR